MKIAMIFIVSLFFLDLASAQMIKIGVKPELKGNISALFYNISNGVLRINPELYNSGSIPYKSAARLDILNSTDTIFTGWSKEEELMPGERRDFEIFYYTPRALENLTAKIRMYYGFEVIEQKIELKIENVQTPKDVFQIKNFRAYDDFIKFQLRSSEPLKNVLIIPRDYMMGWMFEQKKIENLEGNRNTEVVLPYKPSVWLSHNITIDVVTEDGGYYSTNSFSLQREKGILKYIHYLTDKLSLILNL